MKRRMAAIMVGDIVGYSAMMEKSEEKTVARLTACQTLISKKVASLDGRIFNRAGDATLAEFPSPINVRCAVEIGVALAGIDGSDVAPLKMRLAFGSLTHSSASTSRCRVFSALKIPIR